jgi:hypothetical protein
MSPHKTVGFSKLGNKEKVMTKKWSPISDLVSIVLLLVNAKAMEVCTRYPNQLETKKIMEIIVYVLRHYGFNHDLGYAQYFLIVERLYHMFMSSLLTTCLMLFLIVDFLSLTYMSLLLRLEFYVQTLT